MNQLFRNITTGNYIELLNSFERSKEIFWKQDENRLVHPGEYGAYREELLKRFLSLYVPETFGISSGFIITSKGHISHQCDIIIYDKEKTPKIQNMENQRFFPIETVLGVGEVKSTINSISDLNSYLVKLSTLKTLRNDVEDPTPYKRGKFKSGFNLDIIKINYNGIDHKLWHNMVFSLKDGLLSYQSEQTKNLYFSFGNGHQHNHCFLKNDDGELPQSVNIFLSALSYYANNGSLLEIHMERYLTNNLAEIIE